MIGGFSPGFVFGPVRGTSAGRLGCGGRGGPEKVADDDEAGAEVVGGGTDTLGRGADDVSGEPPDADVQATQDSSTNAANVHIRPTSSIMPHRAYRGERRTSVLWKTGTVWIVTFLRQASPATWPVEIVTDSARRDLERLVADDPYVNAVVASRLAAYRTIEPSRFGGRVFGIRTDHLVAAMFNGGNLLPIGGEPSHWLALASHLAGMPRGCTSIVARAEAAAVLWPVLEPAWGAPRAIRDDQPLLVLKRGEQRIGPDLRVRVMRPSDVERYLPAAAAMFTEELGVSPFAASAGGSYRRRVETLLASGRAFGIIDDDGRMAFKADIGALSSHTCQVQGVWVRPDLRGRGLGTAALAGVLQYALRLAPSASLYVNDFNAAARRMYAKLGMRQVATLSTVLF
jgi:hypothetical protein